MGWAQLVEAKILNDFPESNNTYNLIKFDPTHSVGTYDLVKYCTHSLNNIEEFLLNHNKR